MAPQHVAPGAAEDGDYDDYDEENEEADEEDEYDETELPSDEAIQGSEEVRCRMALNIRVIFIYLLFFFSTLFFSSSSTC